MAEIRIPKQKSAIEKRNKIIKEGFNLICEKGYYNVSTPDIAEASGVSTGIIYQYFNDKHDIFLEGVKDYSQSIIFPMLDVISSMPLDFSNLDILLSKMIDKFISSHTMSKQAHEELIAMSHLDSEISAIFRNSEIELTEKINNIFKEHNIFLENPLEKIHLIYNILDFFCHEVVYHKHPELNYDIMKKEIIKTIKNILN